MLQIFEIIIGLMKHELRKDREICLWICDAIVIHNIWLIIIIILKLLWFIVLLWILLSSLSLYILFCLPRSSRRKTLSQTQPHAEEVSFGVTGPNSKSSPNFLANLDCPMHTTHFPYESRSGQDRELVLEVRGRRKKRENGE